MHTVTNIALVGMFIFAGLGPLIASSAERADSVLIEGRVIYEPDASPVSGLPIRCFGTPEGKPYYSLDRKVITNESGEFTIPDAPPGRYSFYIEREPDSVWTHRNVIEQRIVKGNATVEMKLVKGRILKGMIVDYNGLKVSGALVHVGRRDAHFRVKSNSNGLFSVHVPIDDYRVEVLSAPGPYRPDRFQAAALPEYCPDVLARVDEEVESRVVLFRLYPTVTPEPQWPEPYNDASDPTVVATRHIVEWIASGKRMPGCETDFHDWKAMRERERFLVLCGYLPDRITVGKEPRVRRVTQAEYDEHYKTSRYDGTRTAYIIIRWIEVGDSGQLYGFWVDTDFGYLAGHSHKVMFTSLGGSSRTVVEHHGVR